MTGGPGPRAAPPRLDRSRDAPLFGADVALQKARVPTEMHLYAHGGHAFGLRRTELPITEWPQLVEKWLVSIGMLSN